MVYNWDRWFLLDRAEAEKVAVGGAEHQSLDFRWSGGGPWWAVVLGGEPDGKILPPQRDGQYLHC